MKRFIQAIWDLFDIYPEGRFDYDRYMQELSN